ncbi:PAS domain S-box protein [Mucilaginibacter sp. SD-g]|uniref:histidine kinase n=2 Tax=Mucilaginibacter segetis TaxID=2793071 RepID=A0A934PS55_9SPHI|nr:PAS domain S-box protein [Mucilaginibacter segetis]
MLAAIIMSSDDAIISKTLDGIITSWNPAAERLFGYDAKEAIGQHITLIIPDDRLNEEKFIIRQIASGKKVDHFETLRQRKNGQLVPISLTISPVLNSKGKVIGASKIARDISARQQADEKQARLAAIVDTSDDTILSKTLNGIITSWNKAAVRMFGFSEAEAIGRHISLIIPEERIDEEDFIIGEIRKGNKVAHFQTIRQRKDGSLVPISLSVSPIIDKNGNIIGASKIARDISGEQELYRKLKEINAKKDEFIALASHELKTPLTSINGYLQLLEQRISDKKSKDFVQKMRHQVTRLTELVDDILDVSKIEAGKLKLHKAEFDILKVVKNTIDLIANANPGHQLALHTSVKFCNLKGDEHRIEQLLINLLTNAIRYSPDSNKVEIFVSTEQDDVKIGVKDFGLGISQEKLPNIFSRFYRVDDSDTSVSGLGIGLYLCYEIVTRHHGMIWAESKPGFGSTFWFTLPIKDS